MASSSAITAFYFGSTSTTPPLIAAVGNVAFSLQRTPLDVTSIGSWNTYFIDGVASSAFTLDVYYSRLDHSTLLADILNPVTAGRPWYFEIHFGGSSGSPAVTDKVTGYCIITSFDAVSAAGDVVRGSFSAQVIGSVMSAGDLATEGVSEAEEEE